MSSGNVSSSSLWADAMVCLCCVETVVMACWVFCLPILLLPPHHHHHSENLLSGFGMPYSLNHLVCTQTHRQYSKVFCAASLVKELLASYSQPLAEASFIKGRKIYKG